MPHSPSQSKHHYSKTQGCYVDKDKRRYYFDKDQKICYLNGDESSDRKYYFDREDKKYFYDHKGRKHYSKEEYKQPHHKKDDKCCKEEKKECCEKKVDCCGAFQPNVLYGNGELPQVINASQYTNGFYGNSLFGNNCYQQSGCEEDKNDWYKRSSYQYNFNYINTPQSSLYNFCRYENEFAKECQDSISFVGGCGQAQGFNGSFGIFSELANSGCGGYSRCEKSC